MWPSVSAGNSELIGVLGPLHMDTVAVFGAQGGIAVDVARRHSVDTNKSAPEHGQSNP